MNGKKCGWNNCKFNEDGVCNEDVYIVSIHHPNYEMIIYNKNSEEVKKNCRCLTPNLGQYIV